MKELKTEEDSELRRMLITCMSNGPFKAIRVNANNLELLAEWCGEIVTDNPVDHYLAVFTRDPKGRPFTERADIGDWIVCSADGRGYFDVYCDGVFRSRYDMSPVASQSPDDFRKAAGITETYEETVKGKYDEIQSRTTDLVMDAMEYQDIITQRGGSLDEGHAVAEFVGLAVRKMIET